MLWRSAALFAAIGVIGATLGSTAGKAFDGKRLLFLFAILMVVVGVMMLRRRPSSSDIAHVERLDMVGVAKIAGAALLVGALSGFFGIGGGFLIVPGLIFATGMPMINAIGSSLLSVGSFGATTAVNYALSGLVAWVLAAEFIGGGVVGGLLGMQLALRLAPRRAALTRIFAGVIFVVAAYMLYRSSAAGHRVTVGSNSSGGTEMQAPLVKGFFDQRTFSVQYVVADADSGQCAIIDPVLDFDPNSGATATWSADALLAHVQQQGCRLQWILDTHPHADHLSAAGYLKDRTGAPTAIGEKVVEVTDAVESDVSFARQLPH